MRQRLSARPRRIGENKLLASQNPLRASAQGQHENANGYVIGNEHGIALRADYGRITYLNGDFPPPLLCGYFPTTCKQ
jgi:hypothetical protein